MSNMVHSTAACVAQIFADAKQPGYQGSLEVISFVIVMTMIAGTYAAAAAILFYALY